MESTKSNDSFYNNDVSSTLLTDAMNNMSMSDNMVGSSDTVVIINNECAHTNDFTAINNELIVTAGSTNNTVHESNENNNGNSTTANSTQSTADVPLADQRNSITTNSPNTIDGGPLTDEDIEEDSTRYQRPECKFKERCFNKNCGYNHPQGWRVCNNGVDCDNFYCMESHPFIRKKRCNYKSRCKNLRCLFLHPSRGRGCPSGDECRIWQCTDYHSNKRLGDCPFGESCYNSTCKRPHPPSRRLCSNGSECVDYNCALDHPKSRMARCNDGIGCTNKYCAFLHPPEWKSCGTVITCVDTDNSKKDPSTAIPVIGEGNVGGQQKPDSVTDRLKSKEQRDIERKDAGLPILSAKEEFCQRLKRERVLVVVAETGSGKSTQLSQYAAEYFGGLVVCTQPRVIAAISLARRVAQEYDGISVGKSVGYRVGHASVGKGKNRVPGTDIIFMTDAALIQENQENGFLRDVRVLIIDEAHERSVYTDIVLGMAKLLLQRRRNDFHVVISSATVDPSQFLIFFELTETSILRVPGRLYSVSLEYSPKVNGSIVEHAVSTLFNLYDLHKGHTLVFLPGIREIQEAMERFTQKLPRNCVALPLYSALSPEEQNQVLQFDEDANDNRRMVVFCTNIAETSVTINNVQLIIDSGLVKQVCFDCKRRMKVIETIQISNSSADQRKGRAGRTACGHCVRLYNAEDLTQSNIEPAILRTSLDLVALQILSLKLKLEEFPFVDPPEESIIQETLTTLRSLSCIDCDNNVTELGKLFNQLSLDPHYSAFLVDTYLEHGPLLDLITTIVAILVVPNFRSDMIGALAEEKVAAKNQVIEGAKQFDSDLLYLVYRFKQWSTSGEIDPTTQKCKICHVYSSQENSCSSCRANFSRMYLLNNRSLCIIENMHDTIVETLKNPRWSLNPKSVVGLNESEIISINLKKYFPERCGHLLAKRSPNKDACMVDNKTYARLSDNSVFSHRKINNPNFIAMSVAELPSKILILEQLHPLCSLSNENQDHVKADSISDDKLS